MMFALSANNKCGRKMWKMQDQRRRKEKQQEDTCCELKKQDENVKFRRCASMHRRKN